MRFDGDTPSVKSGGGAETTMRSSRVVLSLPVALATVSVTVYEPGAA